MWNDLNNNGVRDGGEPGIGGVGVSLYADDGNGVGADDGDGVPNTCCDYGVMWTTTGPDGLYQFTGVEPGRYFIRIEYGSFSPGQPLFGFLSSTGVAEPGSGVDNDDSGVDVPLPLYSAVHSPVFEVTPSGAPVDDGDDDRGNQTLDFGFHAPANGPVLSFGNLVWLDDGDGVREEGEPGLANVGVGVTWAGEDDVFGTGDDAYFGHGWTDAEGRYQVVGLPAGKYRARVENWNFNPGAPLFGLMSAPGAGDPEADVDGDDNGVDSEAPVAWSVESGVFTLTHDGEPDTEVDGNDRNGNQTLDFGFWASPDPPVLSLGGTLWRDADADGLQAEGEPGIPGVGLTLMSIHADGHDVWMQGGGTDELGHYRFDGLPGGTYRVVVWNWNFNPGAPLEGLYSSPSAAEADLDIKGDDNGVDAVDPSQWSIYSRRITLAHGTEPEEAEDGDGTDGNHTLDFGFIELPGGPSLTLGGTVFRDADNNGSLDGSEVGIPGAFVALWMDDGNGVLGIGDYHITSVPATDANGDYRFGQLPPGDYLIQLYAGQFTAGAPLAGLRSSLSQLAPEPLVDPNDDADGDDNGVEAAGLGEAFMVITRAVAMRPESEPTIEDGDPNTNLTVDFGFYAGPTLELGGVVFHDANHNGEQDAGESGLDGVVVELWHDHNPDGVPSEGDGHFLNVYTEAGGRYRAAPLVPGDYLVVIRYYNFLPGRPLSGLRSSFSDRSPEPVVDPDTEVAGDDNGFEFGGWGRAFFGVGTQRVTLGYGEEPDVAVDGDGPNSNATVDFGFYPGPTASIGNLVFRDTDNNGLRDNGEPGIENVHVKLFFDNGDGWLGDGDEDLGVDVSTDTNGAYTLAGLPAGDYLVVLPWDNWWPGHALNGLRSSTGNGEAPDPDTDSTDGDDNGEERVFPWWPSVQVASLAFSVGAGTEFSAHVDFGLYAGATLQVGGTLFRDENDNGQFEAGAGDGGVPNVVVELFADANLDGVLSPGDNSIGQTRTDASGNYRFAGLLPGDYLVWISRWEHFYGQGLTGVRVSTATALEPDDDVDHDNNGAEYLDPATAWWAADSTGVVTLDFGTEPDVAADGDGPDSNLTVDLGFRVVTGTTFLVNSADDHDDGTCDADDCTLREALNAANASPGADTIAFNIGGGGPQTIAPGTALPVAIEPVVLDATAQPGYVDRPLIELNGANAGGGVAGLVLQGGQSVVRGFVINRFDHGGIHLLGASHNVVQGNYIGTDSTGSTATGGTASDHGGIYLSSSSDNQVGGTTAIERNLVSGGNCGIRCDNGWRNAIEGNFVGTDVTGSVGVGNSGRAGIWVSGGGENRVGGTETGAGNLVSGNNTAVEPWAGAGVMVEWSSGTTVQGNRIGTDLAGAVALGNQLGLTVSGPGVTVGGLEPGSGNVISGNRFQGVNLGGDCVFSGNLVGTDATGTQPLGNASIGVGLWGTANRVGGITGTERNVISANGDDGIVICGSAGRGDHVIQGNFIGTDITGTVRLGNGANGWGPGIRTCPDNNFNVIGGEAVGAGNLIAGNNGSQVDLRSSDNAVQGNRIGTDVTGTVAVLPASPGIGLFEVAERNLIAGNLISGVDRAIYLAGPGVRATRILGNQMGTTADGTASLPNTVGVDVADSADNVIGGTTLGEGNTIAFNSAYGIGVSGEAALNNAIRGNAIHSNGTPPGDWLGLDLVSGTPVTPNDLGDSDTGPNRLQNYPVLLQAAASATALLVEGRLNSRPNTNFRLDLYASAACDPTGFGEGEHYLGTVEVLTDTASDAYFYANLAVTVVPGRFLTATATDPDGNTSEFSACREVILEGPPSILQAATRGSPNQVMVLFSESVDALDAADANNYVLSCGEVTSATLEADHRTVTLVYSGTLTPDCTLTVNSVQDLAGNTVVPGTQVLVQDVQGVITRRVYLGVAGSSSIADLKAHPAFPDSPDLITYETAFEAPPNFAESYGQQMAGYLTPPTTGDYVFYLASDDGSELYLSPDADPNHKELIAQVTYWILNPRAWNDGVTQVPADQVFSPDTRFIEAEDFDFDAGHQVTGVAIGMTGPYTGGAFAGLGTAADAGLDWNDLSGEVPDGQNYRPATGIETTAISRPEDLTRGAFDVTVNHKLGWNNAGEWLNYTRDFGPGAQEYWVFARLGGQGSPMAAELAQVTSGHGTPNQTTLKLGAFRSAEPGGWDNFIFVPLTDDDGQAVRVSLGGLTTLRFTVLPGSLDFDYLAFVPTGAEDWLVRPENRSAPLHLVAGQRYYVEAIMKEWGSGDHLAVAWQTPSTQPPVNGDPPIPGGHLSSTETSGPVTIVAEPADQAGDERGSVTFTVKADGTPPYQVQWYADDGPIPGATAMRLALGPLRASDDGARIHAVVANAFSSASSRKALLTVLPDAVAPTVVSAVGSPTLDRVTLTFSEPVSASAGQATSYRLNGGLAVLGATLETDLRTVVLITTPQRANIRYTVMISGISDLAETPNPVAPETQVTFSAWTRARGFVLHRFFQEVFGNNIDALRTDPRFPDDPTRTESVERIEWPPDGGNEGGSDYGNVLSGWLVPPVDGAYTFYVSADDPAEVYLSTDETAAHKQLICQEPAWNNPRMYRTLDRRNAEDPENVSDPIPLAAGQRYYFEILHTEGGGGDNVSLAWQVPGGPEVQDGDLPISGAHVESWVNPDLFAATIASIAPQQASANGPAFTLELTGTGFRANSVVLWNGSPRPTAYVVESGSLQAAIPVDDLATGEPLTTATVTVANFVGVASNPAVFTILGETVVAADSGIASLGETTSATTPPPSGSQPGVVASLQNEGSPEPVTISTATYTEPPPDTGTVIDVGGGYVDVQVTGADPADVAASLFYYPSTIADGSEAESLLMLQYFDGSAWVPVLSSGGLAPLKDTTDNLDATVSGGRFAVIFDATSTPTLASLNGTPFALTAPGSAPPQAEDDAVERPDGQGVKMPVALLLANDSDPDGDPLTLTGFSPATAEGGTLVRQGAWLLYAPPLHNPAQDAFAYTITDGHNGLASGMVTIRPLGESGPTHNRLSLEFDPGSGHTSLRFAGIPGRTYALESSDDLVNPEWVELDRQPCGSDGILHFEDPRPPAAQRYYRTVQR